ncbi:hypothetical protein HOF92_08715 [bacterium]|jgi:hypothetical protein|nr:hypothetical protein [bacterium]
MDVKRSLKINSEIKFLEYDGGSWSLDVCVNSIDLQNILSEFTLLYFGLVDQISLRPVTGPKLYIKPGEKSQLNLKDENYVYLIDQDSIEYCISTFSQFYRDEIAPTDHIHLDVDTTNLGGKGDVTIVMPECGFPSECSEAASKILNKKPRKKR